jgi:hypothetical protein
MVLDTDYQTLGDARGWSRMSVWHIVEERVVEYPSVEYFDLIDNSSPDLGQWWSLMHLETVQPNGPQLALLARKEKSNVV